MVAHQQPALAVLGVDHAGGRVQEGAQQRLRLVALGLDQAAFVDIDQHALEPGGAPLRIQVDPADGLEPSVLAVGIARAVLVRITPAAHERIADGRCQLRMIVRVYCGQHLFQAQLAMR